MVNDKKKNNSSNSLVFGQWLIQKWAVLKCFNREANRVVASLWTAFEINWERVQRYRIIFRLGVADNHEPHSCLGYFMRPKDLKDSCSKLIATGISDHFCWVKELSVEHEQRLSRCLMPGNWSTAGSWVIKNSELAHNLLKGSTTFQWRGESWVSNNQRGRLSLNGRHESRQLPMPGGGIQRPKLD